MDGLVESEPESMIAPRKAKVAKEWKDVREKL
jgi:hypothetical protein